MNYSRGNAGDGGEAVPGGLVPVSQQALLGRDPYSIAIPYGVDATADATPVFGLSLHEYLGTLTTLMKTPLYPSTVRMQIDPNTAKIVQSGDVTPVEGPNADFMRTQFELLNGRTMAERVASALKLGEDQDFFRPRHFSITGAIFKIIGLGGSGGGTANKSDRESAAASVVLGNRAVRPVMGSRLVDIDYSDPNPARAQRIASAYADAFVASNLDKRFQANSYAKVFLEDQLKTLKLRLEESEKALLDFAQKAETAGTTG